MDGLLHGAMISQPEYMPLDFIIPKNISRTNFRYTLERVFCLDIHNDIYTLPKQLPSRQTEQTVVTCVECSMYYIHWVPSYFITIQRQPTYSSSRQTDRQTENAAYYTFIVCQRSCDLLVLTTTCSFFLHSVVIFIPAAGNCYLICSSIVVSKR